jgi:hypothetical protein
MLFDGNSFLSRLQAVPLHIDICTSSNEDPTILLLERWSLSVERSTVMSPGRDFPFDAAHLLQRVFILIRSVHSLLRILPAYSLFQIGQSALCRLDPLPFAMFFFLTSGPPDPKYSFHGVPVSNFVFTPVDTGDMGIFHLSVFYRSVVRYSAALPTPKFSSSKIINDYISVSPSPRLQSMAMVAATACSTGDTSLPFALPGTSSDLRSKTSFDTPLVFGTTCVLNATPPSVQIPLPMQISQQLIEQRPDSVSRSRLPALPPLSSIPAQIQSSDMAIASSISEDCLGFARAEAGDDHVQVKWENFELQLFMIEKVGALLSAIREAPTKLRSLEPIPLRTVLSTLEESLASNRSLAEMP